MSKLGKRLIKSAKNARKKKVRPAEKIMAGLREALYRTEGLKVGDKIRIKLPEPSWQVVDTIPKEAVHHPAHYGGADNLYETIKVLEARLTREEFIGAMKFQVYKYNDRALHKGNEIEDYEKGLFYQTRLVQRAKEK